MSIDSSKNQSVVDVDSRIEEEERAQFEFEYLAWVISDVASTQRTSSWQVPGETKVTRQYAVSPFEQAPRDCQPNPHCDTCGRELEGPDAIFYPTDVSTRTTSICATCMKELVKDCVASFEGQSVAQWLRNALAELVELTEPAGWAESITPGDREGRPGHEADALTT